MAGTSKYKAMYESEVQLKEHSRRRAIEAEDQLTAISSIIFEPERTQGFGESKQERDVVAGVRNLKALVSSVSAKATAQGIELARAWHMIRSITHDDTLTIETAALMKALDEGKMRDFSSIFTPNNQA